MLYVEVLYEKRNGGSRLKKLVKPSEAESFIKEVEEKGYVVRRTRDIEHTVSNTKKFKVK